MKDKIANILYDHFGWQRKESIEIVTEKIMFLIEQKPLDVPSENDIKVYFKKEQCLESGVWFRVCMQVARWMKSEIIKRNK